MTQAQSYAEEQASTCAHWAICAANKALELDSMGLLDAAAETARSAHLRAAWAARWADEAQHGMAEAAAVRAGVAVARLARALFS